MSLVAISFSAEESRIIATLCHGGVVDPDAWSAESIQALRATIKSHYIAAQHSKCCYCDRHLASENHRVWDVDHVVPRATHPRFTFEPRNLVASCPDCNIAKRDARVLKNNSRKTYPSKSEDFKILHPHLDTYGDHIFRYEHIYLPKTEKGKRTIYACDLLRFAQKYMDWATSLTDVRYETEVEAVMNGGPAAVAAVQNLTNSLKSV